MSRKIVPILLAGGAGTRLWPISRDKLPKQFLPILGDRSSYQETLLRVQRPDFASPIVITGPEYQFCARRQAEELGIDARVVVEPLRRDTAPAIAAGTMIAAQSGPEVLVLVLAADHVVLDPGRFHATCIEGCDAALAGSILTFGVRPTEPKTNLGYILPGEPIGKSAVHRVARFVEKPDASTASGFLLEDYLWNSGNLLFRADVLLGELTRLEPEIAAAVEGSVARAIDDLGVVRLDRDSFARATQKSIDYAVLEHTERAAVIVGDFRWSDIGSWDALFDIGPRDEDGNVVQGPVVALDARDCVVYSDARLVTLIGVKDLVVVATQDAVLVVPRARSQEVRELVAKLKASKRVEATDHRRVHRPWGYYEPIDAGRRFQVKRIVVSPDGTLSLQRHRHRAEHWVVVSGTAEVTLNDMVCSVHENESIHIPIGSVHRLANRGRIPLQLIEVQTGSYLGEDDIVRLEDVYSRT